MGNSIIFMILLQVILIALNAVFACAEIAIISMNDTKMQKMASEGNKKAKRLVKLTKEPARFLSTIQIAITLSGFLKSIRKRQFDLKNWIEGVNRNFTKEVVDFIGATVGQIHCKDCVDEGTGETTKGRADCQEYTQGLAHLHPIMEWVAYGNISVIGHSCKNPGLSDAQG